MSGIGFWEILNLFKNKRLVYLFLLFSILIFGFYFSNFIKNYFYLYPKTHSVNFGDGNKQMVNYVAQNENKYKAIYISGYYWRPYVYLLFWKAYDPLLYQKNGSFSHFGKYYFSAAEWDKEGVYFGPFAKYNVDFYSLVKTNIPQETLFILAKPELMKYRSKFKVITAIDGKYVKGVFFAVVLR